MCVCVCLREGETDIESEGGRETERVREGERQTERVREGERQTDKKIEGQRKKRDRDILSGMFINLLIICWKLLTS